MKKRLVFRACWILELRLRNCGPAFQRLSRGKATTRRPWFIPQPVQPDDRGGGVTRTLPPELTGPDPRRDQSRTKKPTSSTHANTQSNVYKYSHASRQWWKPCSADGAPSWCSPRRPWTPAQAIPARVAEPHVSLDLHLDERKKGLEGGTGLGLGGRELPVLRLLERQ